MFLCQPVTLTGQYVTLVPLGTAHHDDLVEAGQLGKPECHKRPADKANGIRQAFNKQGVHNRCLSGCGVA